MTSLTRRSLLSSGAVIAAAGTISAPAQVFGQDGTLDLTGKSVLITGCSSGFGRLTAEHLARSGAKVFATMRNLPRAEGDELIKLVETDGLDIHVLQIDVTSDDEVSDGVAEAERIAGGGMDILINNAGIGITSPVEVQDMEATQLIFDTNVFGPQRMARAALPAMRAKGGGQIFNVSSQLGRVILPNTGHYSATKFALEAMSEQLAYELVPHNIDVTIIEPGGYPTKIWVNRNGYTAALIERSDAKHLEGYPAAAARMGQEDGSRRSADPMDVPRAIAKVIAMPPGKRPLRVPVHPGRKPQEPINALTAKVQTEWLGNSPYGPWIKDVHRVT